ncbi:MAG: lysylphosphatidylglycerol synthase transmembrane domain-containing protein [Candidatus Eisenbacteria bacterium]
MRVGDRNYRVKPGLTIFLVLSVVSAVVIIYLAGDRGTWTHLRELRPQYGVLAALLMIVHWCSNAIRFRILVNSLDNDVSVVDSFKAFMANVFMAAVTPSQTGGGPMQIYMLKRAGVPIAKGFAGCLMGGVLSVFCLMTSTLIVLLVRPGVKAEFGGHLGGIWTSVVVVFLIVVALFLISIFRVGWIKQIIGRGLLILTLIIKTERRIALTKRVLCGVDQYRKSLTTFARARKSKVAIALLFTMVGLGANSLISLVLLSGLNVEYHALNVFLVQFILFFITYFVPTPGASGIAEFSSYWMLSSLHVQPNILGVYTVMWRFFTSFIGVTVGGLVILSLVSRRKRAPRV